MRASTRSGKAGRSPTSMCMSMTASPERSVLSSERAEHRRTLRLRWRIDVKIELAQQPRERQSAIGFDADQRRQLLPPVARRRRQPIDRDLLARLLPAIPRFGRQRQQPDVMRLERPIVDSLAPPAASRGLQMPWRFQFLLHRCSPKSQSGTRAQKSSANLVCCSLPADVGRPPACSNPSASRIRYFAKTFVEAARVRVPRPPKRFAPLPG